MVANVIFDSDIYVTKNLSNAFSSYYEVTAVKNIDWTDVDKELGIALIIDCKANRAYKYVGISGYAVLAPPSLSPLSTYRAIHTSIPQVPENLYSDRLALIFGFSGVKPKQKCQLKFNDKANMYLSDVYGFRITAPVTLNYRSKGCGFNERSAIKSYFQEIEAYKGVVTSREALIQLDGLIENYQFREDQLECKKLVDGFVKRQFYDKVSLTNSCIYEPTDKRYKDDPCCNPTPGSKCKPRPAKMIAWGIKRVKADKINYTCKRPTRIAKLLRNLNDADELNDVSLLYANGYDQLISPLKGCNQTIFTPVGCVRDVDCPFTQKCGMNGFCIVDWVNPTQALMDCFVQKSFDNNFLVEFQSVLGLTPVTKFDVSSSSLAYQLNQIATIQGCAGSGTWSFNKHTYWEQTKAGYFKKNSTQSDKIGCLDVKKCNYRPEVFATERLCNSLRGQNYCEQVDGLKKRTLTILNQCFLLTTSPSDCESLDGIPVDSMVCYFPQYRTQEQCATGPRAKTFVEGKFLDFESCPTRTCQNVQIRETGGGEDDCSLSGNCRTPAREKCRAVNGQNGVCFLNVLFSECYRKGGYWNDFYNACFADTDNSRCKGSWIDCGTRNGTSCSSTKYCSLFGDDYTETKEYKFCTNTGFCNDYEFKTGLCVYNPTKTCETGHFPTSDGRCYIPNRFESNCTRKNDIKFQATWYLGAQTEQECSGRIGQCEYKDGIIPLVPPENCTALAGNFTSKYKWVSRSWVPNQMLATNWKPIKWVSKYAWVNMLDQDKLWEIVDNVIAKIVAQNILDRFKQKYSLINNIYDTISCDCLTKGQTCTSAYQGVLTSTSSSCTIYETGETQCGALTIAAGTFSLRARVTTSFVHLASFSIYAEQNPVKTQLDQTVFDFTIPGSTSSGQFFGNGILIEFSEKPQRSVYLCLLADPLIAIDRYKYSIYDFGVSREGSAIIPLGLNLTIDTGKYCANINAVNGSTYLPIVLTDNNSGARFDNLLGIALTPVNIAFIVIAFCGFIGLIVGGYFLGRMLARKRRMRKGVVEPEDLPSTQKGLKPQSEPKVNKTVNEANIMPQEPFSPAPKKGTSKEDKSISPKKAKSDERTKELPKSNSTLNLGRKDSDGPKKSSDQTVPDPMSKNHGDDIQQ